MILQMFKMSNTGFKIQIIKRIENQTRKQLRTIHAITVFETDMMSYNNFMTYCVINDYFVYFLFFRRIQGRTRNQRTSLFVIAMCSELQRCFRHRQADPYRFGNDSIAKICCVDASSSTGTQMVNHRHQHLESAQ